jgi:3'-5' exoribonuclease
LDTGDTTPRPEPLIISELRLNTIAYGWLFVAEVLTRKTSSGKPYLDLKLRDPRGNEIIGRYFDPPGVETQLPREGKVLELEGLVEKFLNQTYIRVSYARVDESVPIDLFQVGTRHTISQLQDTFRQFVNKVNHPGLHALLVRCFTPETLARFYRWPAAVRHHGAVRSGLLEHTVNVTLVADRLTQIYTCNQNLVLAGALLHDIGKLEELEEQIGAGFTVAGRMFGHVVTIEALLVHQADTAEAKLTGFLDHQKCGAGAAAFRHAGEAPHLGHMYSHLFAAGSGSSGPGYLSPAHAWFARQTCLVF